jgi:hypothetical protein
MTTEDEALIARIADRHEYDAALFDFGHSEDGPLVRTARQMHEDRATLLRLLSHPSPSPTREQIGLALARRRWNREWVTDTTVHWSLDEALGRPGSTAELRAQVILSECREDADAILALLGSRG